MKATLSRQPSADDGTFGTLTLENGWSCRTVELPWRDNQRGISCIPEGVYHAHVFHSPHLNRDVYLLENVPGRQEIEIHNGNLAGDASLGYTTQVHGCILVGKTVMTFHTPEGLPQRGVSLSVDALKELMRETAGAPLDITIGADAA